MENDVTRNILNTIRNIQENKSISKTPLSEEKDITRNMLNTLRGNNLLTEEKDKDKDKDKKKLKAIAITDDPRFGQKVLSSQKEQFRSSVESGAEFTEPSDDDVASSPLIYMPETNNLVFGGIIPCLNNLRWQFVLKTNTGNGCFLWADGLILNKDNLQTLSKLQGFYLNWRDQWISEAGDLEQLKRMFSED